MWLSNSTVCSPRVADDFEEIKQDILSFRFEILNQWKVKEVMQDEMATNVKSILQMMSRTQGQPPSQGSDQSICEEPDAETKES